MLKLCKIVIKFRTPVKIFLLNVRNNLKFLKSPNKLLRMFRWTHRMQFRQPQKKIFHPNQKISLKPTVDAKYHLSCNNWRFWENLRASVPEKIGSIRFQELEQNFLS